MDRLGRAFSDPPSLRPPSYSFFLSFILRPSLEETTHSHLLTIVNLSLLHVSQITPSRGPVTGTWRGRWTR